MKLFLEAYKPAQNFSLAERAHRILNQQRFICEEMNNWIWYLYDKAQIDLKDEACYDLIYKQAKRGMNTKLVEITRYQPNDIPDLRSRCLFLRSNDFRSNPLSVHHHTGFFGPYSEIESIHIDHFENAPEFDSALAIKSLVHRIIEEYNPDVLYLTSSKYIIDILKIKDVPRTGWITYLKNSTLLPKSMPDFCSVEHTSRGVIFYTTDRMFDENNPEHIENALRLSRWFKKYDIKG